MRQLSPTPPCLRKATGVLASLGEDTPCLWSPSPNTPPERMLLRLVAFVLHYTAHHDAEESARMLCDPAREVSAHFLIARDGSVRQMVPIHRVAWHAGQSRWGDLSGMNAYTIGVELVNAGPLSKHAGRFVTWSGAHLPAAEVEHSPPQSAFGGHTHWQRFPVEQVQATRRVMYACLRYLRRLAWFPIGQRGVVMVLGHYEIAPLRKIDPGPLFPLAALRQAFLADQRVG